MKQTISIGNRLEQLGPIPTGYKTLTIDFTWQGQLVHVKEESIVKSNNLHLKHIRKVIADP